MRRCKRRLGFNTQPPKGGCVSWPQYLLDRVDVSTHSRLKAAAWNALRCKTAHNRFNTQPPKGGCSSPIWIHRRFDCFNTQPPKGGCQYGADGTPIVDVSTHSRLKAAAQTNLCYRQCLHVSTHSRLKAAASRINSETLLLSCFNTQPPKGGCLYCSGVYFLPSSFQHTAA